MKLEPELSKIIDRRRAAYRLDWPLVILVLLGGISQTIVPFMTPLLVGAAFVLFYRKLKEAAHMPCPKCFERFGAKSNFPLGYGSDKCQNCGLSIYHQDN